MTFARLILAVFAMCIAVGLAAPLLFQTSHDLSNTRLGRIHEKNEFHSASVIEGEL